MISDSQRARSDIRSFDSKLSDIVGCTPDVMFNCLPAGKYNEQTGCSTCLCGRMDHSAHHLRSSELGLSSLASKQNKIPIAVVEPRAF
jgi:hypothetical protein